VASAAEPPSEADQTTQGKASGNWVQLGALKDKKTAESSWVHIQSDNEDLLKSVGHAVRRADLGPDRGVFFRLRAGPFKSVADAQSLCSSLKSRNIACFVVTI